MLIQRITTLRLSHAPTSPHASRGVHQRSEPRWHRWILAWIYWGKLGRLTESVRRERRELAKLDEHQLRDIGISESQRDREAARSSHDLPEARKPEWPY